MIDIEFCRQRYVEDGGVSRGTLSSLCLGFGYLFHVERVLSVFFVLFLVLLLSSCHVW